MDYIIDLQGFKGPINEFILKEISIIQADDKNAEPLTLFFGPPYAWDTLPIKYKMMNKWLKRNFHGLSWEYGSIPYDAAKVMIQTILRQARVIYVKGCEKSYWLKSFLDFSTEIIDLETLDCPSLRKLPKFRLGCVHHHHQRNSKFNCANENVKSLRSWLYVYRALCERGIFFE